MRALNANLYNWFLWFFDQLNCIPLVRARNHVRPPLKGGLTREVVSLKGGLTREVVSLKGGLTREVVSLKGGLTREVVSLKGGLTKGWSY